MLFSKITSITTAFAVAAAFAVMPVKAEENTQEFVLKTSRTVDKNAVNGSAFNDSTVIAAGKYVLCRFETKDIDPDGIYSAELKFDLSEETENEYSFGLDEIGDSWDGRTATKYSTTYGDTENWVYTTIGTVKNENKSVSFDIKDSLSKVLSDNESGVVNYSFYIEDEDANVCVIKSSVKIVVGAIPDYQNFNNATEENIGELLNKYLADYKTADGESILDEYNKAEDKTIIENVILSKKDYKSLDDVAENLNAAYDEYHVSLFNAADETNIEELILKYIDSDAAIQYNKISDKTEINEEMLSEKNYNSISEIMEKLSQAVDNYNRKHAYLYEEGYTEELTNVDYVVGTTSPEKLSGNNYVSLGSYKVERALIKFDISNIDKAKVRSVRLEYDTLQSFSTWYKYKPELEYTTDVGPYYEDWNLSEITYSNNLWKEPVIGTTTKTDMGTYGILSLDVTDIVKNCENDYISFYLKNERGQGSYVIDKTSRKSLIVEYPCEGEGSFTSNIKNGETAAAVNQDIKLTFSDNINTSTVTARNITVSEGGKKLSSYTLAAEGNTVVIKPDNGLKYGTEYTVKVSANVMLSGDEKHYYFPPLTFTTDVEAFENDGLILTNQNGELITSIKDYSGKINAKVRFKNNKIEEPQKMIVTVSLLKINDNYDEMTEAYGKAMVLGIGDEDGFEHEFTIPSDGEKYMIRLYVWDSLSSRRTIYSQNIEN